MTTDDINHRGYVSELPLVEALWWFIENEAAIDKRQRQQIFFDLRFRYRNEVQDG